MFDKILAILKRDTDKILAILKRDTTERTDEFASWNGAANEILQLIGDREKELEDALRSFIELNWSPDAAPGQSCYLVDPVHQAREAITRAGVLLTGKSPFAADNDGSVTKYTLHGSDVVHRMVWFGGRAYGENNRDLVPEQHRAAFDSIMGEGKKE